MPPSAELHTEDINTGGAPEASFMTCHVQPTVLQRPQHGSSCLAVVDLSPVYHLNGCYSCLHG
jgi:hypothetical protein